MNQFNSTAGRNNHAEAEVSNANKKYLLLADMNGTLCHRTKEQVISPVIPDFQIKFNYVYRRPGVELFVKLMKSTPTIALCVCTSIFKRNAIPLLEEILPEDGQDLTKKLFHNKMTKPDPSGKNDWSTVRDMDKIWQDLSNYYGPTNTIILDNETDKCRDHLQNLILMPSFINEDGLQNETVLDRLGEYLVQLGRSQPVDVRQYLQDNPFQSEDCAEEQDVYGHAQGDDDDDSSDDTYESGEYDCESESDDTDENTEYDIADDFGSLYVN